MATSVELAEASPGSQGIHGLHRQLSTLQIVALCIATVAPFESIFVLYGTTAGTVGTGIFYLFLFGGILAVANALVYSHISTVMPLAGGAYGAINRILGDYFGTVFLVINLITWVLIVPSVTEPAASFLNGLHYIMPVPDLSAVIIFVIMGLALLNTRVSGTLSTVFLFLEILFSLLWIGVGLTHMKVGVGAFLQWPRALKAHSFGAPLGIGVLMAGVPAAMFALGGYESTIHFGEEIRNPARMRFAVVLGAAVSAIIYAIAMPLVLASDTNFGAVMNAALPGQAALVAVVPAVAGIFLIYLFVSAFNAGLCNFLDPARLLLNAGADGKFGRPGKVLAKVNGNGVPYVATLLWVIPSLVLNYATSLQNVLAFTGVTLLLGYVTMSIAAIVLKVRAGDALSLRGGAFWAFPLVPLVVIVPALVAIVLQPSGYLLSAGIIVVAALALALAVHRRIRVNSRDAILSEIDRIRDVQPSA